MSIELTQGERLRLYRKRKKITQKAMADRLGVSMYSYRRMEDEVLACDFDTNLGSVHHYERYYLKRLRSQKTAIELAIDLGISRWWLCRMERGDAPIKRLADYWDA